MSKRLIVYGRYPQPGLAKTRLGAEIGLEASAGVYGRLLYAYLLDLVCTIPAEVELELSLATEESADYFVAAFPEFKVRIQVGGGLGERMAASFEGAFAEGAESVVLTGSDVPALDGTIVRAAFDALAQTPVVLGPACDGGYYLLGMRAPGYPLFQGVEWSTPRVYQQTVALLEAQKLTHATLPILEDMDTVEEYERWTRERRTARHACDR